MSFSARFRSGRSSTRSGGAPIWFGPVFVIMGVAFTVFAILGFRNSVALSERGVTAQATITDRRIDRDEDSTSYVLWYRFSAADGSEHGGTTTVSRDRFDATPTGTELVVTYLPDDPSVSSAGLAEPPSPILLVVVIAFTGLFALVGLGLTVASLRARRRAAAGLPPESATPILVPGSLSAPGERLPGEPDQAIRSFSRGLSRVIIDLVGPPIGAVLFLGVAVLVLNGTISPDDVMARVLVPVVFGFFGILALLASIQSLRRGARRTLMQVGPAGIWMPETDWLRWDEIAEVRLESSVSPSKWRTARVDSLPMGYRRLGIVPVDPARAPAPAASRFASMFTRGVVAMARTSGAPVSMPVESAPVGLQEYEITGGLGPIIAAVRGYRAVTDRTNAGMLAAAIADERRSSMGAAIAGDPAPSVPTPSAPARELSVAEVAELDALLAPGAIRPTFVATPDARPPAPMASAFVPSLVATAEKRGPATSRTFGPPSGFLSGRPFGRLSDLIEAGREAFFSAFVLVATIAILGSVGRGMPIGFALLFVIVIAPFAAWAATTLLELPSRLGRVFADDDDSLAVGPDGIWLPIMGRISWTGIDAIRVSSIAVSSSSDDGDGGPERWRITIVPRDAARLAERPWSLRTRDRLRAVIGRVVGRFVPFLRSWREPPGFSVDSDRLNAPIDEVVELIEAYHPIETD